MNLILFCAHDNSVFAINTLRTARLSGVSFSGVIVRKTLSFERIREEMRIGIWSTLRKVLKSLGPRCARCESFGDGFKKYADDQKFDIVSVSQFARNEGIKFLKVNNFNDQSVLDFVGEMGAEIGVFAGGGLVRKPLIDRLSIINCHMGVLPTYRGHFPWVWASLNRDFNDIGLSLHVMDTGIDTGPILDVLRCDIRACKRTSEVRLQLEYCMTDFVVKFLVRLKSERLVDMPKQYQSEIDGLQYFVPHAALVQKADRMLQGNSTP